MAAPLASAVISAGSTLIVFGAGTLLVTSVLTTTVKSVIRLRQRRTAVACGRCEGRRTRRCMVCKGSAAIDWSPFEAPKVHRLALCPLCAGAGSQACFNCLGRGTVQPG